MDLNIFTIKKLLPLSLSFNHSSKYQVCTLSIKKSNLTHLGVNLNKSFSTYRNFTITNSKRPLLSSYRNFTTIVFKPSSKLYLSGNIKFNLILLNGMKSTVEIISKEGKKVADKALATQASNIRSTSTSTTSTQSSPNVPPKTQIPKIVEPNTAAESKQSAAFDNYQGPLQPEESIKSKITIPLANSVSEDLTSKAIKDSKLENNSLPTYKNELSPEAQRFNSYENAGIIKYDNKGSASLTREASLLYSISQPKPTFRAVTEETPLEDSEDALIGIDLRKELVAGTLSVDEDTEMLSPIQSHIVIGEKTDTDIELFALATSDKGQQAGIAGFNTTNKISDIQISGNNTKAQYIRPISPPISVTEDQFHLDKKATDFINDADVRKNLELVQNQSQRFEPTKYKGIGYTRDDFDAILETKNRLENISNVERSDEINNNESKIDTDELD